MLRQPHPYTNPVWNGLFTAVTLFALNNVLSHAIARVARQRESLDDLLRGETAEPTTWYQT